MKKFPEIERKLVALVPPVAAFFTKAQRTAFSGALAGLTLLAWRAPVLADTSTPLQPSGTAIVPTSDRERRIPRLVLRLASAGRFVLAQHRSHASHASHRSHASHYSGAGGSAPQEEQKPVAPRASTPTPAPQVEQQMVVTIQKIDRENRMVVVKDELGTSFEFHYRDDTQIRSRTGLSCRLDECPGGDPPPPHFSVGDKVRVEWRTSADKKKRMAVKISHVSE